MDAKELRLVNLVSLDGRIATVYQVNRTGAVLQYEGDTNTEIDGIRRSTISINDIQPIKLTEDIVESLGFKICDYMTDDADPIFILNDVTLCCDSWNNPSFFTDDDLEIKSVHQLQNLYFALTGEELDVTNIK